MSTLLFALLVQPMNGLWVLNEEGQALDLIQRAQEGRAIAIIVMKSGDCPVCIDTLRRLSEIRPMIVKGAVLVAPNKAKPTQNAHLRTRQNIPFSVLTDQKGSVLKRFGLSDLGSARPKPGLVFLDPCGRIDEIRIGRRPGQKDEAYILRRLRSLQKVKCDVVI